MPLHHVLLALLVVALWGGNFTAIKLALGSFHPLTLCVLRFFLASLPLVFVARPRVAGQKLACYSFFMFVLQFVLLFSAMRSGISAGLASLVLQAQVIFSLLLGLMLYREVPRVLSLLGAALALAGLVVIGLHPSHDVTVLGFGLVLAAAAAWSVGNVFGKQLRGESMFAVVVWASGLAWLPLALLAIWVQGAALTWHELTHWGLSQALPVAYIVVGATWVGYGGWNFLIARYPLTTIAPFTLLVPVIGLITSAWMLHERLSLWKGLASLLIVIGLGIHIVGSRRRRMLRVHQ